MRVCVCTLKNSLQVRAIVGSAGAVRHVTEMAALMLNDVDPTADEAELQAALDRQLQSGTGNVSIDMWQLPDGWKRARVRLPHKNAKQLNGTS